MLACVNMCIPILKRTVGTDCVPYESHDNGEELVEASKMKIIYDPVFEETSLKITISSKLQVVIIYHEPSFLPRML